MNSLLLLLFQFFFCFGGDVLHGRSCDHSIHHRVNVIFRDQFGYLYFLMLLLFLSALFFLHLLFSLLFFGGFGVEGFTLLIDWVQSLTLPGGNTLDI